MQASLGIPVSAMVLASQNNVFHILPVFAFKTQAFLTQAIYVASFQCMCGECAKELRLQSNKCPICRQPIGELIEIKINNGDQ